MRSLSFVAFTMTRSSGRRRRAEGAGEVDRNGVHIGAREVVHGDGVGAARAWKSTVSSSLTSMVTLATSRKNRKRLPFGDKSMFSEAHEPLNHMVSVPAWPSTVSPPSPGSHTSLSFPR